MFGNLLKPKLSDDVVIVTLANKTNETKKLLERSYRDFLTEANELEKWGKLKHIGLLSLSFFLTTSQFFKYSSRENKSYLLDECYFFIISDTVKFLTNSETITEENFNKFAAIHRGYSENLESKFPSFLDGTNPPVNDFVTYCSSEIFGSNGLRSQLYIQRVITVNLVEIKNYVQKELG
jgi:hypothetical protein